MRVLLREGGDVYPIDLVDLDERIRQGLVSADAELKHPPWTGPAFRRLRHLEELQDALRTPEACFSEHLRMRRVAWLTGSVALLVLLMAVVQTLLVASGEPWALERLERTFSQWAVGLEPTLLDGRWWTLWASQIAHMDLLHALFNVPIIAYCGYRVEQALGPSGAMAVMAAALLGGGLAIVGLDDVPVFGSSIIAYGLWTAQIVIGLRMRDAIPPALRGRYGMGNFIFFAPLYAASLFNAEISHLGHAGGIVGGGLVAMFLHAESMAAADQVAQVRQQVQRLSIALSVAPIVLLAVASQLPQHAVGPYQLHEVETAGVRMRMPARMIRHPVDVGGLSGWRPSENGNEPLFADLVFVENQFPEAVDWWSDALGVAASSTVRPEPLGPQWSASALQAGLWRVEEHRLQRGKWLLRVGFVYREPASALTNRRAVYVHVLRSLRVLEIPDLQHARVRWELRQDSSILRERYARQLRFAGRATQAEVLLSKGTVDPETMLERLTLWQEHPEVEPVDALSVISPHLPRSEELQAATLQWLTSRLRCQEAVVLFGEEAVAETDCVVP